MLRFNKFGINMAYSMMDKFMYRKLKINFEARLALKDHPIGSQIGPIGSQRDPIGTPIKMEAQ
jgi:hypothetical protein